MPNSNENDEVTRQKIPGAHLISGEVPAHAFVPDINRRYLGVAPDKGAE